MCIKINKICKQELGIRWVQKRFPRYGVPIWSLWPNIRFLPSIVAKKNARKNILDRRKDRGKTVYHPPPSGSGGIIKWIKRKQMMHENTYRDDTNRKIIVCKNMIRFYSNLYFCPAYSWNKDYLSNYSQ